LPTVSEWWLARSMPSCKAQRCCCDASAAVCCFLETGGGALKLRSGDGGCAQRAVWVPSAPAPPPQRAPVRVAQRGGGGGE
jgi:hypothetical protein